MKNVNIIGIIPARGGSKGLPRKNLLNLQGKPLIAWTIESALKSGCFQRVIVSTDDREIAKVAEKWGAEVPFLRPKKLAEDHTPTLPVLLHAVSWLESNYYEKPAIVVTLQPTSPLRLPEHIKEAVRLMRRTTADSAVSVCAAEHSPYWMKRLKGNRVYSLMKDSEKYFRRQDLPPVYRLNGAVYATRYKVLTQQKQILGKNTKAVIMDAESSIDIDTRLDFKIAEMILKERKSARN